MPLLLTEQTLEQAMAAIQYAIDNAEDEADLRAMLTQAGIDGEAVDIHTHGEGGFEVHAWGPNDTIIEL